jgi:hypothetical protein
VDYLGHWVLARASVSQTEFSTIKALADIGILAWTPRRITYVKVSRYCRRRVEQTHAALAPYIFIFSDKTSTPRIAFGDYFKARGVHNADGSLMVVRDNVIEDLRGLEHDGAFNHQQIGLSWRKGEVVIVSQGAFTATGKIERDAPDGGRVHVRFQPSGLRGAFPSHVLTRAMPDG